MSCKDYQQCLAKMSEDVPDEWLNEQADGKSLFERMLDHTDKCKPCRDLALKNALK